MTSPSPLLALEGKLVEAKEGSRELDALIAVIFFHEAHGPEELIYATLPVRDDHCELGTWWRHSRSGMSLHTSPPVTTSIDAALALVFRTLTPIGFLSWGIDGTQKDYNVGWVAVNADGGLIEGRGEHKTPALALCLALVRALTKRKET